MARARKVRRARRWQAAFAGLVIAWAPAAAGAEDVSTLLLACEPCHGADGIARDAEVPHLAGQNEAYLVNQILAFREGKRPHKEMRYMARHLTPEEIQAIAAYYASLPR